MQAVLDRFTEALPKKPYCTDDLRAGLHVATRRHAIEAPYIQLNGVLRRYLTIDHDQPGAAYAWEDARLPGPTIIMINPVNAHAHLTWELDSPVLFPDRYGRIDARPKPQAYYKAILAGMREQIGGDPGYVGMIIKNPLHERWHTLTYDRTYTLEELAEYLTPDSMRRARERQQAPDPAQVRVIPKGYRNDTIFDLTRHAIYSQVCRCGSFEELFNLAMLEASAFNTRCDPALPSREIVAICKSVGKWTWSHRDTIARDTRNRGVMDLEPMPPVMEVETRKAEITRRQAEGAQYTHQARKSETEAKIRAAIEQLRGEGKRPAKAAVSRLTGLDRVELSKRWSHLFEV